jgi:splicing factor 1
MPTILPHQFNEEQTQIYLLQIEIEELTRRLRTNQYSYDNERRSPSPEPIYDSNGKRINTREVRKKQELEQRRHEKIQKLLLLKPDYAPPADYRAPNIKYNERIFIPQDNHPEINFVGLLIGPRGNTLKALEQETGAKIIIRGKGSLKEGKLNRRDGPLPGENEPLHAYICSNDREIVAKAAVRIRQIIDEALTPSGADSALRKEQLRQLALLNGTLRNEDALGGTRCSNCGSDQHKTYECSEAENITASIFCTACGGGGHLARDCISPTSAYKAFNTEEMNKEYQALMAEINGEDIKPDIEKKPRTSISGDALPFSLPPQRGHPSNLQSPTRRRLSNFQAPTMPVISRVNLAVPHRAVFPPTWMVPSLPQMWIPPPPPPPPAEE